MELLAGCGGKRIKEFAIDGSREWRKMVTLDINPAHNPDVVHDLNVLPLPFPDDTFEEIHFYEVLEHIGQQGDWKGFFAEFSEYWRILKPGGLLLGTSPAQLSAWCWGDPGHTRVIAPESFTYLNQPEYDSQIGKTAMTDYRFVFKGDFDREMMDTEHGNFRFVLKAVKPSRISV